MSDIPAETQIISIDETITGQPILTVYDQEISQAAAPTLLTISWEIIYTATTRYENLSTLITQDFRNTRHFSFYFLIAGISLTFVSDDANFVQGPDRRHTYDGVTDYSGQSGRTTVMSKIYTFSGTSTNATVLAALTGAGSATLGLQVFFQDVKSPGAGAGAAWNNADVVTGTVLATLT